MIGWLEKTQNEKFVTENGRSISSEGKTSHTKQLIEVRGHNVWSHCRSESSWIQALRGPSYGGHLCDSLASYISSVSWKHYYKAAAKRNNTIPRWTQPHSPIITTSQSPHIGPKNQSHNIPERMITAAQRVAFFFSKKPPGVITEA